MHGRSAWMPSAHARRILALRAITVVLCAAAVAAIYVIAFLFWMRRKNIDTVLDLELFSRITALLTGLSGADRRVGFHRFHNEGLYRGEMLTHRVAYNPHIHISKNLISLVEALSAASVAGRR